MVNAWMNTPNGFDIPAYIGTGQITGVSPWAPFLTASTGYEIAHVLGAVPLTGLMILGGMFAFLYSRSRTEEERSLFQRGLRVALVLSFCLMILAVLAGMLEIEDLYKYQPLKYSAIELNANPGNHLPVYLFGRWTSSGVTGGLAIPGLQSAFTGGAGLPGLSEFNGQPWPPLYIHTAFDVMAIGGGLLGLFLLVYAGLWVAKRKPYERRVLNAVYLAFAVLTPIVMELGWMVDEVGRQPWIVYNVLTVASAANYNSELVAPGYVIVAAYLFLIPFTLWFMVHVFGNKSVAVDVARGPVGGDDVNY
jgi:cytochrome d ubiquinol oxidase subunit I